MAYAPKKEEMYGYQTYFREVGYFITRREQYDRALVYFDEAIDKCPEDKRALIGRSWTRAKACQYKGAISDVEKALGIDPEDYVVLAHKALNTYLSCEFEDALVQNIRLVPFRKKPDNFVMGVMHCNEAIENCVGKRAGRPLRDHFKIIRKLAWKKAFEAQKPFEPKSKHKKKKKKKKGKAKKAVREPAAPLCTKKRKRVDATTPREDSPTGTSTAAGSLETEPQLDIRDSLYTHLTEENVIPPGPPFPYRPLQRYTTNIKNYMAERYLESMYLDKIFLENMKNTYGVSSPNKDGTKKILHMSKTGFKTLSYKQELLRTRKPFYHIKHQEATSKGALRARQEAELRRLQHVTKLEADAILEKIRLCVENKESRGAIEFSEKLKIFCDSKPKKILPEREFYLNHMYDLVCEAHFIMKRLNLNQEEYDQEARVQTMLGMPASREPSTDSVLAQFKGVFVDYKKQVTVYEDRLRKALIPEEMAWLYHELSRFNAELKQFELSRVYARKCIQEGRKCGNLKWVINAYMMIVKVNMLQHNRNDAKVELTDAMGVAKALGDEDLLEYLNTCYKVVEKVDFEDVRGPKVLEKREKQIIDMMAAAEMKDEAAYLFRKMASMPAARRMSVMPGVRLEDAPDAKPSATARKMSIRPAANLDDDDDEQIKAASKSTSPRGIGFMELIQFHVGE